MNTEDEFDKCPEDLLVKMDPEQLNHWLSIFIVETRKVTGEPYPPTTIHRILSGILRYMRSLDAKKCPNFFAKKNPRFQTFHNTMDSVFRELRKQGVGSDKKQGLEVTRNTQKPSQKKKKNSFGPQELSVQTIPWHYYELYSIYYNGKCFCLRGGVEHRDLRLSHS